MEKEVTTLGTLEHNGVAHNGVYHCILWVTGPIEVKVAKSLHGAGPIEV